MHRKSLQVESVEKDYGAGSREAYENTSYGVVDVRDVADAHILMYKSPPSSSSSSQRYICCNTVVDKSTLIKMLRSLYPNMVFPQRFGRSFQQSKFFGLACFISHISIIVFDSAGKPVFC
jgi:nucleoside-diphosphate-sugar epimerase